jgi:uncharacterized coiled-coil protein SlyX
MKATVTFDCTDSDKIDQLRSELMAAIDDITAKLDTLQATMQAEHDEVTTAVADMQATIADLRAQLESMLTAEQFALVMGRLDALNDQASHVYDAVTTPPVEPPPAPEPLPPPPEEPV